VFPTVRDQNYIQEEIKNKPNSWNLSSSRLFSKNLKFKMYKTIILSAVMYECGTWSLTPREEHTLRVFENRVLRRIFGLKGEEMGGG
jgi:hypothetical protein